MLVSQPCPTLCDSMDCSPPGSPVHGILQARTLEWGAIPFSRGSSHPGIDPRSPTLQADSLTSEPPGKPVYKWTWYAVWTCVVQGSAVTASVLMQRKVFSTCLFFFGLFYFWGAKFLTYIFTYDLTHLLTYFLYCLLYKIVVSCITICVTECLV